MPFKNLAPPRQVTQLDAEVRSAALLHTPEIVAVLSSNPVRIAIHQSSSQGRTTNLSIREADEVAMLSRDVALVRSSDTVWSVLNIAHTPKIDQAARDSRQLVMRPTGNTALSIAWDGTATELILTKNDVDSRTFPLRGDVRSCDMTATDTYVVVDKKGDGGELRVHPGATPESGANWRATLPREAAPLDRLRAGAKLCAVYKRGNRNVCVVLTSGGRLVPKMIQLTETPLEIGVLETTMFAIFPSGQAALFNEATLLAADSSPVNPTASIQLMMRGEPRMLFVSGRGSPVLWIGSSAGDVVTVAVVRQTSLL